MNINLTHDFASYLAEHLPGNIRELEGAIVRLGKELKVTKNTITLDFYKKVVREVTGNKKSVTIEAVLRAVSDRFNVSISQLQSKSRTRSLTLPKANGNVPFSKTHKYVTYRNRRILRGTRSLHSNPCR